MRNILVRNILVIVLGLPLLTFAGQPARAGYNLPWCAVYANTTARICAFFTYAQCQAELRGIGGYCYQNPFLPPAPPLAAEAYRKSKPKHVRPRQ
jgi:hypothetical protein